MTQKFFSDFIGGRVFFSLLGRGNFKVDVINSTPWFGMSKGGRVESDAAFTHKTTVSCEVVPLPSLLINLYIGGKLSVYCYCTGFLWQLFDNPFVLPSFFKRLLQALAV